MKKLTTLLLFTASFAFGQTSGLILFDTLSSYKQVLYLDSLKKANWHDYIDYYIPPEKGKYIRDTAHYDRIMYTEKEYVKVGKGAIIRSWPIQSGYTFYNDYKIEKITLDNGKLIKTEDFIQADNKYYK